MKKRSQIYWHFQLKILPEAEPAQKIYEDCIKKLVKPHYEWLDLGCGHQLFRDHRESYGEVEENKIVNRCKHIYGLDHDFRSLISHRSIKKRVRGDIISLPFKNDSFDLITSNMVVEHIKSPKDQFKEINRVLKDNGLFIFHTPNLYSYGTFFSRLFSGKTKKVLIKKIDGRDEEDAFQTYYKINTKKNICRIANETGFKIDKFRYIFEPIARFKKIPEVAVFEILYIKLLTFNVFKKLRTNIICILKKSCHNENLDNY